MAKSKDMKNLVERNGWYQFRGYVPKDLIVAGRPREITTSLHTKDHAVALERRKTSKSEFELWTAVERRKRDGNFLVLDDLTEDQVIGLAREAYKLLLPSIEEFRSAQARRTESECIEAISREESILRHLEIGAVPGSETFGSFEYYTDTVLRERLVRIASAEAYSRLVSRVGDAIIQIKREQIAAMKGKRGTESNPLFASIETGQARTTDNLPDGRPETKNSVGFELELQVESHLEYLALTQQDKNLKSSRASLEMLSELLGRKKDVRTIVRLDFEEFKKLVLSLPPNAKKKYRGTPITKIPLIRKTTDGKLKPETINKYMSHVIHFRNWLVDTNIAPDLGDLRKLKIPDPERRRTKRDIFRTPHLVEVLGSDTMREWAAEGSVFFWSWVVGLYQGIRQGEIAGLLHQDFQVIEGRNCLRLHPPLAFERGERAGKPKTITREVPIHWVLEKLGFPSLFIPGLKDEFVFPEIAGALRKNPNRQLGDVISRKSKALLDRFKFDQRGYKLVFHSTRHTFEDACKRCKLVDGADDYLGGWAGRGAKEQHYGSSRFETWMKEEIDKITYGEVDDIILSLGDTIPAGENRRD